VFEKANIIGTMPPVEQSVAETPNIDVPQLNDS
jgi:hypothetical protein